MRRRTPSRSRRRPGDRNRPVAVAHRRSPPVAGRRGQREPVTSAPTRAPRRRPSHSSMGLLSAREPTAERARSVQTSTARTMDVGHVTNQTLHHRVRLRARASASRSLVGWVRLPYYSLGPGPAREVQPLIRVTGHQEYPSPGKLIMTTVRFPGRAPLGVLVAWLDPHQAVVSRGSAVPARRDAPSRRRSGRSRRWTRARSTPPYVVLAQADRLPEGSRRRGADRVRVSGMPRRGEALRRRHDRVDRRDAGAFATRPPPRSTRRRSRSRSRSRCWPPGRPTTSRSREAMPSRDVDRPLVGINLIDRSRSTCGSRAATWVAPPPG